jgi:hypothetical protein
MILLFRVALRNVLRSPRRMLVIVATTPWGVLFLGVFDAFNANLLERTS